MTLIRSEWTKLVSTRLLVVCVSLAVGLSIVITTLLGVAMGSREAFCAQPDKSCVNQVVHPGPTVATAGMLGDGIPGVGLLVLMLLGSMCLLVEYRYNTISTTFLATPRKWRVALVKAAVVVLTAFAAAFCSTLVSGVAFKAVGGLAAEFVEPWSTEALGICFRTALVVAAAASSALAVAALFRSMVVTAAVVLLWPTVGETLIPSLLPSVSDRIVGFLPFANARHFVGMQDGVDFPWSQLGSGAYFLVVSLALLALGTVVLNRSDVR